MLSRNPAAPAFSNSDVVRQLMLARWLRLCWQVPFEQALPARSFPSFKGQSNFGALEPALAANLRWLSGYRHSRCYQRERAADLRRAFACPTALMDGVMAVGDSLGVLPVLFHLLWRHELETDLRSAPLRSGSLVWSAGGNG